MKFEEKICVLLLVSCIVISINCVTITYNLYFYKKEQCRERALHVLFSQLCLAGQISAFVVFAMILQNLELVDFDWFLMLIIRNFNVMTVINIWLLIGIASAISYFNPSMYSFISYKMNYLSVLTSNLLLR